MALGNVTTVKVFIQITGLIDQPELQLPLFFLFIGMYMITIMGNLRLTILIRVNSQLHTSMHYFLFNLSFIDLCYSSVFTPKMLMNFVLKQNIISYSECIVQLYFFCFFVICECYVLTIMAYGHYVVICNPLLYNVTMSNQVCSCLLGEAYAMGFAGAMVHTGCMLRLVFCDAYIINHYMCDILPLLQLSCTSTYVNELVVFIVVGINIIVPSVTIFASYALILSGFLSINSTEGRSRAFSTCSSHIITFALFFESGSFMYLQPSSSGSVDQGKVASVFYTNIVPMLNPFIYTLRNKAVQAAMSKTLKRMCTRTVTGVL
ncbi:olfactory receptor 8B3-like [Antechinus flavipes]|uniref:olfactory receptor 8B3-like n=1 Tax=Antechinus flavipes TaxID=38775 RepID=UPI002235643A|nr:olfactory receptor 8B3-like [Antechinus flavipes]